MITTVKLVFTMLAGISISACATDTAIVNKADEKSSQITQVETTPSPSLPAPNKDKTNTNPQPAFATWLQKLNEDAKAKGISQKTLLLANPYLKINEKILVFDKQQPEFTQTFWTYLEKRLSELRVQAGRLRSFANHDLLQQIEQQEGVPAEILTAFWGLETNYGTYLGDFSTLEALTTLAYDPRRSDFFYRELIAALKIIDQGTTLPTDMRGSWAGAIGQMQFMPSIYLKHAKDADGDNKADLWHSTADALTSAAAYLRAAGWSAHQPWLQQVNLPSNFDYAIADGKTELSLNQVQQLGVQPVSGSWLSPENSNVTLLLAAGYEGPAFVAWSNFKVIKRWNNSNNYALTVSLLAQRLANSDQPTLKIPHNKKPWSRLFITQLQETLTQQGYDTQGTDGWFGSRSMQALRLFQKAHNLPADGYPNTKTLEVLNLKP